MAVTEQQTHDSTPSEAEPQAGWRVKLAFAIFIASLGWPLIVPVLAFLGVSAQLIAAFTGVMLVAAEVMLFAAAAIAGKPGFAYIKARVFGFLKAHGPPRKVSRVRYTIGLVMFVLPFLFGWGSPYFGHYIPGFEKHLITYAIVGDVMLVSSLFVLGGDFWDKLRSLFVHEAYAVMPGSEAHKGAQE
jgi:hypothetical protein